MSLRSAVDKWHQSPTFGLSWVSAPSWATASADSKVEELLAAQKKPTEPHRVHEIGLVPASWETGDHARPIEFREGRLAAIPGVRWNQQVRRTIPRHLKMHRKELLA
jgi:hypothetical protein